MDKIHHKHCGKSLWNFEHLSRYGRYEVEKRHSLSASQSVPRIGADEPVQYVLVQKPPDVIYAPSTVVNHNGVNMEGKFSSYKWKVPCFPTNTTQRCVLRIRQEVSGHRPYSYHARKSGFRGDPGNFCLWNPESWSLESGIQLKESRISLTTGIQSPSPIDKD